MIYSGDPKQVSQSRDTFSEVSNPSVGFILFASTASMAENGTSCATCCIHFSGVVNEDIKILSEKSSERIRTSIAKWKELDGEQKAIADRLISELGEPILMIFPRNFGYHRLCYFKFTDKTRVEAATKRVEKRKRESEGSEGKRVSRSQTTISHIVGSNLCTKIDNTGRLFGNVCVICQKTKYITDKRTKVRKPDKLVVCQTYDAAQMLKSAAEEKKDQKVLLVINDEDLIAKEAKYHHTCYKRYTISYKKNTKQSSEGEVHNIFSQEVSSLHLNQSSTDMDTSEDDETVTCSRPLMHNHEEMRQLFHSAMTMKSYLQQIPKFKAPWPPLAADLTCDTAAEMIPHQLFNFLAWLIGCSAEVPDQDKFVAVTEEQRARILSVCQDVVYLANKCRKPTPKHLALGLTVRHLTGCTKLISILHGLGHSMSPESILDYDSALAEFRAQSDNIIPAGVSETFTSLVFDNNDFGEETLSGKGTTHVTNGIIVQQHNYVQSDLAADNEEPDRKSLPKVRAKRFQVKEFSIPSFHAPKRQGPPTEFFQSTLHNTAKAHLSQATAMDTAFVICKLPQISPKCLPGWTGFNTMLETEVPKKSFIGYLPVIDGSPTRMDVVNAIVQRCISIADRLKQESLVVVMDQAIYHKAQHIRWQDPVLQQRLVLRLGEFHTAMAFLGTIGKRFREAGLQDIIIESGVVAEGSVNGVISGHHYNRSIRTIKLLFEAVHRLLLQAFLASLDEEEQQEMLRRVKCILESYTCLTFAETLLTPDIQELLQKVEQFAISRAQNSDTFSLWLTFLKMCKILLAFIRATRTGNWQLHLAAVRNMLPWFFAYDRINYARYLTAYWVEMINLPVTHPAVYDHLQAGEFVVQQQGEHSFAQTAMDQTIEQTLNRDTKSKGGLIGQTLNTTAMQRWILSAADRASILLECQKMAGVSRPSRNKKDLDNTRIQRDEKDVNNLVAAIEDRVNPFTYQEGGLINIATGTVATPAIEKDYARAESVGEEAVKNFISTRLVSKERDIFAPISSQRLKTFSALGKKTQQPKTEVIVKANAQLLARMLVTAKVKEMDMNEVLSYSLSPVPPSLGNYDGTLAKTNKAKLLHHLEDLLKEAVASSPAPKSSWIIDGMAYFQQMKTVPSTFGELALMLMRQLIALAKQHDAPRVDFVTDIYSKSSIKNMERCQRGDCVSQVQIIISPTQKIPCNFRKFLSSGVSKTALLEFIYNQWQLLDPSILQNVTVFLALRDQCHSFSAGDDGLLCVDKITDLTCDHEEADTRIFLHAQHALLSSCSSVVLRCSDTDVFIIALSLMDTLNGDVSISMGTSGSSRLLNINSLAEKLSSEVRCALTGLHVFTGCDTVSCFKGKGKVKAFELMKSDPHYIKAFKALGSDWDASSLPWQDLEHFVCHLYGQRNSVDLNRARSDIFKSSFRSDTSLPPTHDEFLLHTRRANFQAAIHRRALQKVINAPSPLQHGWCLDDNNMLGIQWMTGPLAPDSLLKHVHCSCKKSNCSTNICSCKAKKLKCTELCTCNSCTNCVRVGNDDDEDDDVTAVLTEGSFHTEELEEDESDL